MDIADETLDWIMEGPSWIRYRASIDLLGRSKADLVELWREVKKEPLVSDLVAQVDAWPWPRLTSHKSAAHPLHKLVFLADLGFGESDCEMRPTVGRLMEHRDPEGPFQAVANVSKSYGGTGLDTKAWALCDSPSIAYSLATMGLANDERVGGAVAHLRGLARSNGWPCAVSKEMGKFRGPGRKVDPCPYANLVMLKLLSVEPSWRRYPEAKDGVEAALALWSRSREEHPYQFYMGTDFRKLKAPFVWYDIMHLAEVLSRFPFAAKDERMAEIASIIREKMDAQGRLVPESVWMDWKRWEFGQKNEPSRWLTLAAYRILERCDG
ncbi:MAG: hypothetical protein LUQ16_06695 [Methanomassiliicoccales archaeon]|jgi:hypothetical protein|nr:hypothetical protein [Methanomassiliicoccales archaeon]MDD1756203.1 hypothetical protein [Methanomassiliicoccales archaeon]